MNIVNAPNITINTDVLIQMVTVAQASMQLWEAEEVAANARYEYHQGIRCYEAKHGPLKSRLSANSKAHAGIRKFTAETYEANQISKRKVTAAKRRLKNACWKLAIIR